MKIEPLIVSFLVVALYESSFGPDLQVYVAPVMSNGGSPAVALWLIDPSGPSSPVGRSNLGNAPLAVWQSEFGPIEALRYQKPITLGSLESSGWPFEPR